MQMISSSRLIRRLIVALAAILALPIIALAPAYLTSLVYTSPTSNNSDTSQHVSTLEQDETKAVETVLVIDPQTNDVIEDEFTATINPREETEENTFRITVDESAADILDSSDFITITFDDSPPDGIRNLTGLDSGCRIYMGAYDMQDTYPTATYKQYAGEIRLHDEERRTSYNDCTLYWIDATDDYPNP